ERDNSVRGKGERRREKGEGRRERGVGCLCIGLSFLASPYDPDSEDRKVTFSVRTLLHSPFSLLAALLLLSAPLRAQAPELTGTWRVVTGAETGNGPREVTIRSDSSASWGRETVRWRRVGGKIWIAIGGEWEIYDLRLRARDLTLSGGDLQKPVTLRRMGPATPRAAGVAVPPDPDDT